MYKATNQTRFKLLKEDEPGPVFVSVSNISTRDHEKIILKIPCNTFECRIKKLYFSAICSVSYILVQRNNIVFVEFSK